MSFGNKFLERDITVDNHTITLKKEPFSEIFKSGDKPFLFVGASGKGKTTIAIDIIFNLSKQATKIYYVSATKETLGDEAIKAIPKCFKRYVSFESLYHIWKEIVEGYEGMTKGEDELMKVVSKLYPKEEYMQIRKVYKDFKSRMLTLLVRKYQYNGDINMANQTAQRDLSAWTAEVLSRLIINGVIKYGDDKLSKEEAGIVGSIMSSEQKTVLIIDDVTSQIGEMKKDGRKVVYNGSQMKVCDAFKALLEDILTRGRHYNCVVGIFVHAWDTLNAKDKVQNFVVLEEQAMAQLNRLRTFSQDIVKKVNAAWQEAKNYDYHFIVSKNGGEKIMVGCASLHGGETLQLDQLNQNYINAYESILTNSDAEFNNDNELGDIDIDDIANMIN